MRKRKSEYLEHVLDLLAPLGEVSTRAMFGCEALYLGGVMFGFLADGGVYLKTDDATRAQFKAAGAKPFLYRKGRLKIEMSYWSVPEAAMESTGEMLRWARLAYAAALRKSAKRPSSKFQVPSSKSKTRRVGSR